MTNRTQLATGLAANQEDLRTLVRSRLSGKPLPDRSPLSRGWRRDHILPEMEAVLEGRRTLRITDIKSEAPLAIADEATPS